MNNSYKKTLVDRREGNRTSLKTNEIDLYI